MRTTKRHSRHAQAFKVRGEDPRPSARRPLRAIAAATLLALIVSLSPDLTRAPIKADEPGTPIGDVATFAGGSVPVAQGVAPQREPQLPPARVSTPLQPSQPTTAAPWAAQRFQAALDTARYGAEAFGVTFAAVRDGRLIWAGSSGVERDGHTALRPQSPMVIGSVTKTFVAATVLRLVDEGRIGLDDSVRAHLPDVRQVSREITVRQLMNHTSGLADVFNETTRRGLEEHPERSWSSGELFATLHGPWYRPGEGWAYANTNYYLLGMIVERVTGSTLEAELDRRFLDPLGLRATRMLDPDDPTSPLDPAWATIFWASGAMSSSAGDLARWGDMLYDNDLATAPELLDAELGRAMLDVNRDDYGLGVKRIELSPRRAGYGHTGLLKTYTALLLHLPREDVTIAMLVNRTQVDLLSMIRQRPAGGGWSLLRMATDS
jgi:D-alanyl-D-alanine carboxypeptidase